MKLTVDCELTSQLPALQQASAFAYLLSKANITWLDMPLEALVCNQYGLKPAQDYPIAAIAASADGLQVGDAFWLRADPVHLTMQRDSFSLSEPLPIRVEPECAENIVASLNQHFVAEGLTFFIGNSGAWYLRLNKVPQIKTSLPSIAIGKNSYHFMPQGDMSAKWRAYLNEAQMLLFTHPANAARELAGAIFINSLWFSGGGIMPLSVKPQHDVDLMVANSPFYLGLAQWSNLPSQVMAPQLDDAIKGVASLQHVHLQMTAKQSLDDASFQVLLNALKTKKIKALNLNLGYYEKTLVLTMTSLDNYKFWRKLKPVMHFLA
ncbi:MAG: hypothetical protein Q8N02_06105 [Methylotenera sp.]|nr:hypothetical protein [Methylotenera sp.]MDO9232150.1 hypothetical protein [Methylotenera sp.]MDO9388693.1 hypothetical protein [Methylotenera sp.]MDP2101110.1 hypothetical protein [Methylotenera sp.]MDP2280330.1 hypothetical protein [Methylotenera sp.]